MERFFQMVADHVDRRSFLRKLGKVGMGTAAAAGVLLLPNKASASGCPVAQYVKFHPGCKPNKTNRVCVDNEDLVEFFNDHCIADYHDGCC